MEKTTTKKGANTKNESLPHIRKKAAIETLIVLSYLLIPSILASLSTLVFPFTNQIWLTFVYLTTLFGIILFFFFKFHHHKIKILALLLGLALSPLYTLIHEARVIALATRVREILGEDFTLFQDNLPYFSTLFATFFYALPFLFISVLILIVAWSNRETKKPS
jgi:hypothetical protein